MDGRAKPGHDGDERETGIDTPFETAAFRGFRVPVQAMMHSDRKMLQRDLTADFVKRYGIPRFGPPSNAASARGDLGLAA